MTELKPCPFCGNTKLNEKVGCRERTRYSIIFGTETIENWFDCVISCSCGTSLELSGFDLPLTAQVETEKAWNTRDGEVEE